MVYWIIMVHWIILGPLDNLRFIGEVKGLYYDKTSENLTKHTLQSSTKFSTALELRYCFNFIYT